MTRRVCRIGLNVSQLCCTKSHMPKAEPTIGVRLSTDLLAAIEKRKTRMAKESPGVGFTTSDVVRHLLSVALAAELVHVPGAPRGR